MQDDTGTAKVALANDENMAGDEEAGLEADTEAGDQGNSGLGASKGSTAAAIQETIVLRVLPSMLRLMHKVCLIHAPHASHACEISSQKTFGFASFVTNCTK